MVTKSKTRLNSYQGRPKSEAETKHKLYFDYDFRKMAVDTLGRVFNIDCWKMDDLIAEAAQSIDDSVSSHTETGNKPLYRRHDRPVPNEEDYGGIALEIHFLLMS